MGNKVKSKHMSNKKKVLQTWTSLEQSVNPYTGEIFPVKKTDYKKEYRGRKIKTPFIMWFNEIELLNRISKNALKVLILLEKRSKGNIVDISPGFKKIASQELNMHVNNVNSYIKELKNADILRQDREDDYMINPDFFWIEDLERKEEEGDPKWRSLKNDKAQDLEKG